MGEPTIIRSYHHYAAATELIRSNHGLNCEPRAVASVAATPQLNLTNASSQFGRLAMKADPKPPTNGTTASFHTVRL